MMNMLFTGVVPASPLEPEVKTDVDIQGTWNACKLARYVLDRVSKSIKVMYLKISVQ
jgi:hypothetical protein